MKKQLIIRIDEDLKNRFRKVARFEGKSASEKIRELVAIYTAQNDFSTVVDDLWDRISEKIKNRGFKDSNVKNIIKDVRSENKKGSKKTIN